MDRTRDRTSRRELIHVAMRLTDEMKEHYAVGRTVLAVRTVTRYNVVNKKINTKVLPAHAVNI